ncbi:amidohydrolase family protein [Sphingobium boeckii]|uniref:Cytosine/adenosine deaminase-related metal-dependent hydrolase n=1 Tax=Sphingobium boeckii TaxID=1082345 RepID=A0A7W9EDF4_9SPHN|nr:amidohydrolase family protein [Sphingobium boeckii]MBB5684874.1 cytosine/adenosine deaminase-related metal-dependent hydrolase [Sphingobium boeckii]
MTMDPAIGDLPCGDVLIRDGLIAAVAPHISVSAAEVVEAHGRIVMPGLVDGHRHVWQSLLRGLAANWTFPQYMVEARALYCGCFDAEDAYVANYIGGLESLNAGITSVVDHSHLQTSPAVSDALARGLKDSGVGGVFCYALQNVPDYVDGPPADAAAIGDLLTRMPDDWHDANAAAVRDTHFTDGSIRFGIALPESAPYVSADYSAAMLARAQALAPRLVTGHWNAIAKPDFYQSSLGELIDRGTFGSKTLLSHNNDLRDDDLSRMVECRIGMCTCPDVELGMVGGTTSRMMARRFVELGGDASLGLDITCFVKADLFKQARLLLQAERATLALERPGSPNEVSYATRAVLELLTITGARSAGLDDEIGSITPGKRADLIAVLPDQLIPSPLGDPEATLVFYTDASDVETVIASGKIVKRHGKLVEVDAHALGLRVTEALARIQSRYAALPRAALQDVWAGMF